MTNETTAPERIWAVTEPDDVSAQILGDVYAQQVPDGMVGEPVEYVRADALEAAQARIAELEGALGPLVKEAKACGRNINAQWVPLFDEARAALEGKG
jgi:hypothetical protein